MENKNNIPTLIVSLDFELFWGMHDCTTEEKYGENIMGAREAIPEMLRLFREHSVHATWATVGFLFADRKNDVYRHAPENKPTYENAALSSYPILERIGDCESDSPMYYAPSIIKMIAETEGQEIGNHTFSHFYCREAGQTEEQFFADIVSARAIAAEKGYDTVSMVLPRNHCEPEYTRLLEKAGYLVYRDEENDWIHEKIKPFPLKRLLRLIDVYIPLTGKGGYLPKIENGIVNLPGSRMYKPYFKPLAFLEWLKVHRIKMQMLNAAKKGLTFHFWWHPHNVGVRQEAHMKQLSEIFSYYSYLREKYGMRSLNMREAAEELTGEQA